MLQHSPSAHADVRRVTQRSFSAQLARSVLYRLLAKPIQLYPNITHFMILHFPRGNCSANSSAILYNDTQFLQSSNSSVCNFSSIYQYLSFPQFQCTPFTLSIFNDPQRVVVDDVDENCTMISQSRCCTPFYIRCNFFLSIMPNLFIAFTFQCFHHPQPLTQAIALVQSILQSSPPPRR